MTNSEMLAEFHAALGDPRYRGNAALRMTLHEEEHKELIGALEECHGGEQVGGPARATLMALARELADVVYIAYGTAHAFGVDLEVAVAEIHRAAMSKLVGPGLPILRDDGKVMKPPGFVAPNLAGAIE